MHEINHELWDAISGANANSNYESANSGGGSSRSSASKSNNGAVHFSYVRGISDTCIENVLGGAALGTLGGTPASVLIGAAAGSFTGGCWRTNGNGDGGGSGSNSDCSKSECSW